MVTKEDLKDWLAENERRSYEKSLEEFIDRKIKNNALKGQTTFDISTGKYTTEGSRKTGFYDLWETKKLSKDNRKIVHEKIIKKYRDFGFEIEQTTVDCGWHNHFFALRFKNIDKIIKEETK